MTRNIDKKTVDGFSAEWEFFDQSTLAAEERLKVFNDYFSIFPWDTLPEGPEGFDFGCGSGRWAFLVSEKAGRLHCLDASEKALNVARNNLSTRLNITYHLVGGDAIPLPDNYQDFGYSLGVLHHIPDTSAALQACVMKLKSGAPFLVYLYYAFDNRSVAYRYVWKLSDTVRRLVCQLPETIRRYVTDILALTVYYPLARLSALLHLIGINVDSLPLSYYKNLSLYTMRTDALDRFGTRLEQRFTRAQIEQMMAKAGLKNIKFSDLHPYWCAVGTKK